ncbi:MAG: DUF616 domain-containing protein [Candidatus Krumholzibacteria bacterium]|nr:DUF616 domain-containing protein [Candidatus Krumholzibacteria bacterium]
MDKIAVYTAVFGGYEGLVPQPRIDGIEYICFTDMPVRSRCWEVRVVEPEHADATRNAREYKMLPHKYLADFETSVWMDANYLIVGDVSPLVHDRLADAEMAVFDHQQTRSDPRDCVYDEYKAMVEMGNRSGVYKDDPDAMNRQIECYREEGYPRHNGLIFSAVLLRRHNEPAVVRMMERWWDEISKGSRRDQLSFNYAAWKENFPYATIEGDLRNNPWFYMLGHHRNSYTAALFRYRLRKLFGIAKHR